MQVCRIGLVLAAGVLFTVAGCKQADVPKSEEPPKVNVQASAPNIALSVNVDDASGNKDGAFEVHPAGLTKGSIVTWTYDVPFSIYFKAKDGSPCDDGASTLKAVQDTTSAVTSYQATCIIKEKPSNKKYRYTIGLDTAPAKGASPKRRRRPTGPTDHCEGCIIDN